MTKTGAWKDTFVTVCMGIMTSAAIGTFALLLDLNTKVAIIQNDSTQNRKDIDRLALAMETVRNEVSANALEIVKVRAECQQAWKKPPLRGAQ